MNRLEVAKAAALRAGEEVLKFDPSNLAIDIKSTAGDFVTEADLASERVISEVIYKYFPDDLIISEEMAEGQELLTPESLPSLTGWILDPIDGTNNFKNGMSYSGISVAYVENGEVLVGAVYDPFRQELYLAEKSSGVTRNGQPIAVGTKQQFDAGTRVCTSNSYAGGTQANLDRYAKLGHVWVDVLGSAVLIMTDVASGRIDLYHHNGLKPWDNAAAFLIVAEAGAKITDLEGNSTNWLTSEVVLGNPTLVDGFILRTNEIS